MVLERELEKEMEDLCHALIGIKPIHGMPMPEAIKVVIQALHEGLRCKLKLEGQGG